MSLQKIKSYEVWRGGEFFAKFLSKGSAQQCVDLIGKKDKTVKIKEVEV